jgi:hypothetical protein
MGRGLFDPTAHRHIRDAAVDLGPNLVDRHLLHAKRMMLAVRADRVSFLVDAPHDGGKFSRHFADEKESSLDALCSKDIEHCCRVRRQRPVVEREHHFLVGKRQALRVLHHADTLDFARVDDKNAARSQRVRMAGAVLRQGQGGEEGWRH